MSGREETEEFDYVIVGAGSAGSVLARRLTENTRHKVCVLEAGPPDRNFFIQVPAGYIKTYYNKALTWNFDSQEIPGTRNRTIQLRVGKTLGGSSSINGMIYNRGRHDDYNDWAQRGNPGWGFDDILPYFRKSERRDGYGDDGYRGSDGPLTVTDPDWSSPLCDRFIEAVQEIGMPVAKDYNGADAEGAAPFQFTINRSGFWTRRQSTARAFLRPAMKTGQVSLRPLSYVARILFEGRRAVGVEYTAGGPNGPRRTVRARREVILSAGALNSPRILQISGIGDPDHLSRLGVTPVAALTGVGQNLMDHYPVRVAAKVKGIRTVNEQGQGPALLWEIAKWLGGRPSILNMAPVPVVLLARSDPSRDRPNLQMTFIPASYDQNNPKKLLHDYPGMTVGGYKQRPESRGWVLARSTDLSVQPELQPNYLTTQSDRDDTISVFRLARKLMRTKRFSEYFVDEMSPGDRIQSDDEILDFALHNGGTAFHWCGSAKMGPADDVGAVVDSSLRVHGIEGLRVVDASVMPVITSGNTNAPTIMIAEKASDMILADARAAG